jgi:antitoxin YokJ
MSDAQTSVRSLIEAARTTPECIVHSPRGLPKIDPHHQLPNDVQEFYRLCSGVDLYTRSAYGVSLVPPNRVVVANPVILVGVTPADLEATRGEDHWSWYIIGEAPNALYVTIDLHPERLGRCYDSHWELHPSDSEEIATSFTELFRRLLESRGGLWYWT